MHSMSQSHRRLAGWLYAICALAVLGLGLGGVRAQAAGEKTGKDSLEVVELRTALEATQRQLKTAQEQISNLQQEREALAASLAEANRAVEKREASYKEIVIQLEALGVDVLSPDPKALEQRLLKAVRERDAARDQSIVMAAQLGRLIEGVLELMSVPDDTVAVQGAADKVKNLLKESGELLSLETAPVQELAPGIAQGRVVSVDAKLGLVVLNLGQTSGLRVGLPLSVYREDREVGSVLVVDVRDNIAGALVRERSLGSDDVKIGDRVQVRAGDRL